MKLSSKGLEFIENFEGVRTKAYLDSRNKPTIGIGFIEVNGKPVRMGDVMSLEEIRKEFPKQVAPREEAVTKMVTSKINQNQFDALVDFAYNLGLKALKDSTLLRKVNINPNDPTIDLEFMKWNHAGGKVIDGLTKRRKAEVLLYRGRY